MHRWCTLHDNIPNSNSNKIITLNQGIVLQSHLYGRACDICKFIPESIINSKDGVDAIVNATHKRDPLSVVSTVYSDLIRVV